MFPRATLTFREVHPDDTAYPLGGRCKSGHLAPPSTRFFMLSGQVLPRERWGVYCEHCLKVAHALHNKQKVKP